MWYIPMIGYYSAIKIFQLINNELSVYTETLFSNNFSEWKKQATKEHVPFL